MQILSKNSTKVYPAVPTQHQVLYLAAPDHFVRPKHVAMLFLFSAKQDGTEVIPSYHLKESLTKLLVPFYPLAGRLRRRKDKKLEIVCNDDGAEFIEVQVDASLEDMGISVLSLEYSELLNPSPKFFDDSILRCPLLYVQVTRFACGGAALVFALNHTALDGMSVGHFSNAWSEIATGREISLQPFHNRTLLKSNCPPGPQFQPPELRVISQELAPAASHLEPSCLSPAERMFTFSPEQLKKLKSKASQGLERGYFSTFESINAHVWRSITRSRGLDFSKKTKFLTTLDIRKRVKPALPDGYIGNGICFVSASATVGDILQNPLSFAANRIREAISSFTEEDMHSVFAWTEQQEGTIVMNVNTGDSAGQDVAVSSWIRMKCYHLDFGSGKPIFVGPCGNPYDGNVIMLPSHKGEGYMNIFIGLNPKHMELLEKDSEFLEAEESSKFNGF
ncbi:hypothetical protein O6H91_22G011100 [Diphasiastrum complanatum]|uniref:Uncharacterized protein n=1 Tax=Diphasiastrum complanatum TaxID=34168 RepID=A0ACC2ACP7_DIPCM|nr:hypothetical protein O6H91_Y182500 [Diphasiastrum complanatum]KAJ7515343.1 hypothetical protein O6H91_22G011100 [Diphasiastrum complanatum]